VAEVTGIVIALRGCWPVSPATQRALRTGDAVVVDLSVPPALTEDLAAAPGERFLSADGLALVEESDEARVGGRLTARLDQLIDSVVAEFAAWLDAHERRAAAEALIDRANAEREAELAQLWRRVPQLDAGTRDAIDGMTRHLAARLLRGPLERLGQDRDGHAERAVRELFGL
jgi:glutamyl-tRNA reductase